jgi:hypothetical protein|tara:strand:+ start:496 stop:675 length:180 start_codon:yes stop_codon:yes gene_type:complete
MKLHYNKPYNFVKGLTITEIITFAYITILGITAFAGIIILFATAIIDPESFDSVGGMIK